MHLEIDIVFLKRTKLFRSRWCRSEKKLTMDERIGSFREIKKRSFLHIQRTKKDQRFKTVRTIMNKLSFCTVQTNFQKDFKKAIGFYTEQTILQT